MTKNPLINAASASAYILLVVTIMNYISQTLSNKPDTFGAPLFVISMFTLSAAVMAYLFLFQPLQLLIDGKKKAALNLFAQTVGIFAAITAVILVLLMSGLI